MFNYPYLIELLSPKRQMTINLRCSWIDLLSGIEGLLMQDAECPYPITPWDSPG